MTSSEREQETAFGENPQIGTGEDSANALGNGQNRGVHDVCDEEEGRDGETPPRAYSICLDRVKMDNFLFWTLAPSKRLSPPLLTEGASLQQQRDERQMHTVDLSQRFIDSLPSSFFLGEHATYKDHAAISLLNLAHNHFVTVPPLVAQFINLISLDISNNQLALLPKEISSLKNLRELSLRNNLLENLPKEFQRLQCLRELNISGNLLEHFPRELLQIKSLRVLYLGANRLQSFPSDICRLSNLQVLYLGGNALVDVPDTIGQLSELTSLGLADNRLEQIPTAIASLRNLRNLALHNNRLKFLPPGIARLKNLEYLSLRNNPLVTDFVNEILLEPASLKELAARVVKIRFSPNFCRTMLPSDLLGYLGTANQCVNPKCKGVYFEACAELVKFVDFCGKYRVPLLHYLCSPRCSTNTPAYAYSSGSSASESDDDHSQHFRRHHRAHQESTNSQSPPSVSSTSISANAKMKKVLLG
ncbi:hypothetical protein niasHT_011937 [Heterodera trifolii]|uniref:Disease resistance R13L4/SHOC-2-like LRR domain-containing protein n=2 Tax=Heterodera TaxID=34509 RepID=A0ABD2KWI7_9BILA